MKVGPRFANSKFHGGTSNLNAEFNTLGPAQSGSTRSLRMSIPGELRDLPGQHEAQFLTQEYGEQRHMAYDSPLAQPAYSEHGKVRVF